MEDHTFNTITTPWAELAMTSFIVRGVVNAVIMSLNLPQFYYELKYQRRENLPNPRLFTLFGLWSFPLVRIIYVLALLITKDINWGSISDYVSIWAIFLESWSWLWVGCNWGTLAFFAVSSSSNSLIYVKRMWALSVLLSVLGGSFAFVYCLIVKFAVSYASIFFTGGLLSLLALFGTSCVFFGITLVKKVKEMEREKSITPKILALIIRIRNLATILIITIITILVRDLIFYTILKIPLASAYAHLSNFITMIIEIAISYVMMVAVAEKPKNYITFRIINPSLLKISPSVTLKEPRGIYLGSQRKKQGKSPTPSLSETSSSSSTSGSKLHSVDSGMSTGITTNNSNSNMSSGIDQQQQQQGGNWSHPKKEPRRNPRSIHMNVLGTNLDTSSNRNSIIVAQNQSQTSNTTTATPTTTESPKINYEQQQQV